MQENPELLNKLDVLKTKAFAGWFDLHSHFPERLYHYTSASGLIGILTTKTLWMTDLRYMNDLSELQYSRDLIREMLNRKSEESDLTDIQKEFLRRIKETFDPFSYSNSVYSTSFCEKGNLLSQWRAYRGQGGGYAIGIDFFHTLKFLDKICFLRKVIYDKESQTGHINDFINVTCSTLAEVTQGMTVEQTSNEIIPLFCKFFSASVGEFMFCFKHPDFQQEEEWRLVYFSSVDPIFNRSGEEPKPEFRAFDGNVIPYHKVSFDNVIKASINDLYGVPFPIAEVVIGPTINGVLNQQSLRQLLNILNSDFEPNIRISEIALRWL